MVPTSHSTVYIYTYMNYIGYYLYYILYIFKQFKKYSFQNTTCNLKCNYSHKFNIYIEQQINQQRVCVLQAFKY